MKVRNDLLSLVCIAEAFFRQIKSFMRFHLAFVFGLLTYHLIDFHKNLLIKESEAQKQKLVEML